MPVSRRSFLAQFAAASAALPVHRAALRAASPAFSGGARAAALGRPLLLDLEDHCALRESVAGFARGLKAAGVAFEAAARGADLRAPLVVVPAAIPHSHASHAALRRAAESGSTVLYECGAAYASPAVFAAGQRLLERHFGLRLRVPLHLWAGAPAAGGRECGAPYVQYRWPVRALVRDFSRILPVSVARQCVIGSWGEAPVACRLQFGEGAIVFLGSPLGPHLLAGDPEAHAWLRALAGD